MSLDGLSTAPVAKDGLKALLVPYPSDQMRMWEISPRVNSPKNDDPSLWEPLHAEPTETTTDALELLRE
jgi:putative SOS response-associated peptidase YedK